MIDAATPEAIAHIGLIDLATLRAGHVYGDRVAGFLPGVAGGWQTPPPPQKTPATEGETAA